MKTILDLRTVCHRREDRVRAHILLCWLALLLIWVAETKTGRTWPKIRTEVDRERLGILTGPAGTFAQHTQLSQPQKALLAKLRITEPLRASSTRHRQRRDLQQRHGLVTRPVSGPTSVCPAQNPDSRTISTRSCGTQERLRIARRCNARRAVAGRDGSWQRQTRGRRKNSKSYPQLG
jgi:hypothetical protein